MRLSRTIAFPLLTALYACSSTTTSNQVESKEQRLSAAPGALESATVQSALSELRARAPGLLVQTNAERVTKFAGVTMATGKTAEESVASFLDQHASALGADRGDLVPLAADGHRATQPQPIPVMFEPATKTYKFSLYRYRQERGGVPVYRSRVQLLVRNDAQHALVQVDSGAQMLGAFQPSVAGQRVDSLTLKTHLAELAKNGIVTGIKTAFGTGTVTSDPEPVIYVDPVTGVAQTAGVLTVEAPDRAGRTMQWEVVADAETGAVLYREERIVFDGDVAGVVQGNATPDHRAPHCSTPAVRPMMYAQVTGPSSTSAYANAVGSYTLPTTGTDPVTLTSRPSGRYFVVNDYVSTRTEVLSSSVTAPATLDFTHNQTDSEFVRSQVNAYVYPNVVRDWTLSILPTYPVIATQQNMAVWANRADGYCPGNAWYDPSATSINFCIGSTQYANTAFAGVIYHEYGHHLVNSAGSGQGAYGEGMSDTIATLIDDDAGTGYGFFRTCTQPLRTADNTCQYSASSCSSCGSAIHTCGTLLSGAVWSTRNALRAAFPETYRQILNDLTVNSILLHTGSSITPSIATDFLTLDDNDGDIGNGTPHRAQICSGFEAHGLMCPELSIGLKVTPSTGLSSVGPIGGPFAPSTATYTLRNYNPTPIQYTVNTTTPWITVAPTSGELAASAESNVIVSLNAAAAQLGVGTHHGTIQFVNATDHVGDRVVDVTLRVTAPVHYSWNLDTDPGWTRQGSTWQFGPARAGGGDPSTAATGTNVYGNILGGVHPHNMSQETLTTGAINCSNLSSVSVQFRRWLGVETRNYDRASLQASRDGVTWTDIWTNPYSSIQDNAWTTQEYDLSAIADHQPTVYLRWTLGPTDGSVAYSGWNIDDIAILGVGNTTSCQSNAECDDNVYCNGQEQCNNGTCSAGTAPSCDDGIACTNDACVESTRSCGHTADNSRCADTSYCNGAEVCNPTLGCQAGQPVNCDDGVSCTVDSCSESTNSCGHVADNTLCSDGLFCTGAEVCNATLGCQAGTPPCPASQCNEQTDTCSSTPTCTDGAKNGNETDVDCGGSQCPKCGNGKICVVNNDCSSSNCVGGICQPAPSTVTATVTATSDWGGGYCAKLTVRNNGATSTRSWTVGLNVPNATITGYWNGNFSANTGAVTVTPVGWNAAIPAGGVQDQVGFCANRTSGTALPTVTSASGQY